MTKSALDCGHVVRQLWDYLDGRLPEHQRTEVIAHLEECAACAAHYTFERSFLETVGRLRRDDSDFDALKDQVIAALREKGFSH